MKFPETGYVSERKVIITGNVKIRFFGHRWFEFRL
jgi:hypothetical protein